MQGSISPAAYHDPNLFDSEQRWLFGGQWIFVGMRFELQGLKHYGVRVGDTNLLIQCDASGQPRAFLNTCAHRHAQLCTPGLHSGAVRCPYHGWVYDREGVPVGIPGKAAFPQVVADPASHRLTEFDCQTAGQFIFVRLAKTGVELRNYLGEDTWQVLGHISESMRKTEDEFRREVNANWKVVIENSLEGYHVPAVHSATFMEVEGMEQDGYPPVDHLDHPLHSAMIHPANTAWLARFARTERKIGRWPWRFEHYFHRLIFPNLTITSFMGYSFHVQSFEPTAPEKTTVHSRTIGVHFDSQDAIGAKMIERIYADGHAFTQQVFAEDGAICARVQAGVRQARRFAVIGKSVEDRVSHFHNAYTACKTAC